MNATCSIDGQEWACGYSDGPEFPTTPLLAQAERAYRDSFLEAAREAAKWDFPDLDMIEAAWESRRHTRRQAEVLIPSSKYFNEPQFDDPESVQVVYRTGHEVEASRARGRVQGLEIAKRDWWDLADLGLEDDEEIRRLFMRPWAEAVATWAGEDLERAESPPRPLDHFSSAQWQAVLANQPGPGRHLGNSEVAEADLKQRCGQWSESWDCLNEAGETIGRVYRWKRRLGDVVRMIAKREQEWVAYQSATGEPADPVRPQSVDGPVAAKKKLKLVRADLIEMRPPDWLLRGTLERDTFALVFGDPGCGKSFVAIDWACRIATRTPWRGNSVQGGTVVYIAGEGQQGFGRRIRAWSEFNGVDIAGIPLFVAPAVAISNPSDLVALAGAIDASSGRPVLIVVDTLARSFGAGDENSTQDMSQFVSACDAIRQRYGCTILVVHHTGHGDKSRARGAIALKAALDAEYRLENHDNLLLTATKMKDAETPPPLTMELVTVELPGLVDEFGNPITSAAINVLDADVSAIVSNCKAGRRGKQQVTGLDVVRRLASESDQGRASAKDWHLECEARGMQKSTRYSVLAKLQAQGALEADGDWLIPT